MSSTCALSPGVLKNPLQLLLQHCGGSFLQPERGGGGRRKRKSGSRQKRFKLWGFQQWCCWKGAWKSMGAMQPATWTVLTLDNGGLSVFLTSLSHAGSRQPYTYHSQQARSNTLTHYIIEFYTRENHSFPGQVRSGPSLQVDLTGTLPWSTC